MRPPTGAGPLMVVSFTGNSGLTDYAASFCREASKTEPVILVTAESVEPLYRQMGFPVDAVFRRSRHYPLDIAKFVIRVLGGRPRMVLFQGPLKFPLLDALVVRIFRFARIPVAVVVHDVVPHNERRLSTWALHVFYRSFRRRIVHSREAEQRLLEFGISGETLTVPHGAYDIFDLDQMTRDEARVALGVDSEQVVALFFGNLEERKGLGVFVEAAELNRDPKVSFLAAGRDFLGPRAPRQLQDAIRGGRVVPGLRVDVGRVPHQDVQKYFRSADVVVLPYLEGSTSGVLKLALAFGIPVLATEVGDLREQLAGHEGWFLGARPSAETILEGIDRVRASRPVPVDESLRWSNITPKVLTFLSRQEA